MRRIIQRKLYDTDQAEQIIKHGSVADPSDFHALAETLYRDSDGDYFLHCQGGASTKYATNVNGALEYGEEIRLLTREEVLDWCEYREIDSDFIIDEFADLLENINETE